MQTTEENGAKQKYFPKQKFLYPQEEISGSRGLKGHNNLYYVTLTTSIVLSKFIRCESQQEDRSELPQTLWQNYYGR